MSDGHNVILAGTVRFPAGGMDAARERMREMMRLSRAEDGCIEYVYSEDLIEPGLVHVFEIWRDAFQARKCGAVWWPCRAASSRQISNTCTRPGSIRSSE